MFWKWRKYAVSLWKKEMQNMSSRFIHILLCVLQFSRSFVLPWNYLGWCFFTMCTLRMISLLLYFNFTYHVNYKYDEPTYFVCSSCFASIISLSLMNISIHTSTLSDDLNLASYQTIQTWLYFLLPKIQKTVETNLI